MNRFSQVNVDMTSALKKWKPIVEKLGVTDLGKIESMCEYAELHSQTIQSGKLNENVAYANIANTAGMGSVVMPGLSGIPGQIGTFGSGDLGQTMLPGALKIAAQTIGLNLLPTINVNSNRVDLLYFDFTYDDTPGFDGDERASSFKVTPNAANIVGFKAWLRATMVTYGVTELRGGISKPMFFQLADAVAQITPAAATVVTPSSGTATAVTTLTGVQGAAQTNLPAAPGSAYDPLVRPAGSKYGQVEFKGFSRIDERPMFRIFTQENSASAGAWGYDQTKNTLPPTGSLTSILSAAFIADPTTGIAAVDNGATSGVTETSTFGTVTDVSLVSLNEDFLTGFATNMSATAVTRGAQDTSEAGKIGPNSKVASVEIGVAHVSAALRLSEIGDFKRMYGIDIVQKTQAQLVNQMSQQISSEIVTKVKELAERNRLQVPSVTYNSGLQGPITSPKMFDFSAPAVVAGAGGEHNASVARKLWNKVTQGSYFIANDGRIGGAEYIVTSGTIAASLKGIEGYIINPIDAKLGGPGQLQPAGTVDGMKIYVDPYQSPADLSIYLGRVGKADEPGLKFLAYMLAESVEITSEKTMGPRLYMYSRYAIAEFGWFPEKQYLALKVYDPNGILY